MNTILTNIPRSSNPSFKPRAIQLKKYLLTDSILLGIIIIAGGVLRFYHYHLLPFSYDEFSALFRTRFDNFSDLIRLGVVATDTHPAGIQVFMYYWVKLFGEGEEIVKLPFMIAGLGAIYLAYKLSTAWFNSSVGLVTAMMVSFLQYTVTYSQYARPYISGLFFVLLFAWSFHNAFVKRSAHWKYHNVMYVLSGAACAYNHHFSLFFLGLAGLTGLLIVPRQHLVRALVSNALIFLLYVPHLNIFFTQLNKGGVETWLRKPEPQFFFGYLSYLMHHSLVMYLAAAALFALSLYSVARTGRTGNRFRLLMFTWVVVTWVTAYYYSVYRNAVLQYSVLIFTFPFLVMLVFSLMGRLRAPVKYIMVIAFGVLSLYTLVTERRHYQIQYNSVLEQTLAETARARQEYGEENVALATNISDSIQYYYSKQYRIDPKTTIFFDSTSSFIDYRNTLESAGTEYLAIGWVNISDLEFYSVAREVYPYLVSKETYYTGDFYLLSKSRNPGDSIHGNDREYHLRLDSLDIYLNAVTRGYPMIFDHNRVIQPGWLSYCTFYSNDLNKVVDDPDNYLLFTIEVENPRGDYESMLIFEVTRGDEVIYWTGRYFYEYTQSDWGRCRIHLAIKLSDLDFNFRDEEFRVYLSNIDEAYYYLNYFRLEVTRGNPVLYSLFGKTKE
jgi:hypothetical protein